MIVTNLSSNKMYMGLDFYFYLQNETVDVNFVEVGQPTI